MKRYLYLYKIFMQQYLKKLMQSKLDFFMGFMGFFLNQVLGIVFLQLVFERIPSLNGWSFYQLVFIYGFAQIPRGIDHFFTDYLWTFTRKTIKEGSFDRYLLRPINPLFQILVERCQVDGIGEVAVGILLVIYAGNRLGMKMTLLSLLIFIIAVIAGAIIYMSVKLFFASNAFFMKDCYNLLYMAYNMSDFAKYPSTIYSRSVNVVLSYVLPFAFTAFIPAKYFLTRESLFMTVGMECIVAVAAFAVAYGYFKFGVNRYESAGN